MVKFSIGVEATFSDAVIRYTFVKGETGTHDTLESAIEFVKGLCPMCIMASIEHNITGDVLEYVTADSDAKLAEYVHAKYINDEVFWRVIK